jgi:exopolysaccharide biosynthesis polyprenyl glycosylphosphotransferase
MNERKLLNKFIFFDILSSILVWVSFVAFRKTINDFNLFGELSYPMEGSYYLISFLFFPCFCLFTHYLTGFYQSPQQHTRITTILSTFVASAIISFSVFIFLKIGDVLVSLKYFYLSMSVLFLLILLITLSFRSFFTAHIRKKFRTKKWTINTLIIGTGENALKTSIELDKNADKNTLIGYIGISKSTNSIPKEKLLGKINNIDKIITDNNIKEIIIATEDSMDEKSLFGIINPLFKHNISILFTPRLHEIITGSAKINQMGLIPLVSITNPTMSSWETSVKRCIDITVASLSLLVLSPLLLYFILRIKWESKGSWFYKQERIGRLGKPFTIYKFRTMYLGSENGTPKLSSPNDERITPTGRILRKYRIDEIPQFWNILKGEMSLVGPRPERQYFIDKISAEAPYYCLLYKIRPGLTSWGPIKVGYTDTLEKMINRLNYDIIYLENMSLFTDIKILIYTIEILFNGKGM